MAISGLLKHVFSQFTRHDLDRRPNLKTAMTRLTQSVNNQGKRGTETEFLARLLTCRWMNNSSVSKSVNGILVWPRGKGLLRWNTGLFAIWTKINNQYVSIRLETGVTVRGRVQTGIQDGKTLEEILAGSSTSE